MDYGSCDLPEILVIPVAIRWLLWWLKLRLSSVWGVAGDYGFVSLRGIWWWSQNFDTINELKDRVKIIFERWSFSWRALFETWSEARASFRREEHGGGLGFFIRSINWEIKSNEMSLGKIKLRQERDWTFGFMEVVIFF